MNFTRVEAIVHDNILTNKRAAVIEDYEEFISNDDFYNDVDHTQIICSKGDLEQAIEKMNSFLEKKSNEKYN
jgi:hypothetical protein